LQVNSIGFLIDSDEPMIWRGPMVSQALQQLLNETQWDQLDYLIVDLPPGTGDIQLTLMQKIPVAAAVVVTTPQEVATLDAGKAVQMFAKLNVPTLGLVENMSQHVCGACGHVESIFGSAGGQRLADRYALPLLAQLPLDSRYREDVDAGLPTVAAEPQSTQAKAFTDLALQVSARLAQQPLSKAVPELKVKLSG
jgi:ATP-binding protein involved in chromosome partitioning